MTSDAILVWDENKNPKWITPEGFTHDLQKGIKLLALDIFKHKIENATPIIGTQKHLIEGINQIIKLPDDFHLDCPPAQNFPIENQTNIPRPDVEKPRRIDPQPIKQ